MDNVLKIGGFQGLNMFVLDYHVILAKIIIFIAPFNFRRPRRPL